jgi:hypothetical protein
MASAENGLELLKETAPRIMELWAEVGDGMKG